MQPSLGTIHILNQFLWPDDAPTGIYAEQVADALAKRGFRVALVAGSGSYRKGNRPAPHTPVLHLPTFAGRRGSLLATAVEYWSVRRAFAAYIRRAVAPGDVVVLSSAPPTSLFLHGRIRAKGAVSVYWLQDYYPQLVRGLREPPAWALQKMEKVWGRALASWDFVVKAAANLGYEGGNARVIRNWNTLDPGPPRPAKPLTALYSGNLGYGHDIIAFIQLCERLRQDGFTITVRGDGPGMSKLPPWIRAETPLADPELLLASYWAAEVHLIAADPAITRAVFPSKLWNSLAVGRPVLASGFAGPMADELETALKADFSQHVQEWATFLAGVLSGAEGGAG
jgi:hypothetical protein